MKQANNWLYQNDFSESEKLRVRISIFRISWANSTHIIVYTIFSHLCEEKIFEGGGGGLRGYIVYIFFLTSFLAEK